MDTVNYEMIKQINRDAIQAQAQAKTTNEKIHYNNSVLIKKLEVLSKNSNLKYLNFKIIAAALLIGLIIGVLSSLSYFSYVAEPKEIVLKKEIKKLENDNDFLRIYLQKIVSKIPVDSMNK